MLEKSREYEPEEKLNLLIELREVKEQEIEQIVNQTEIGLNYLSKAATGPESKAVYNTMKADCIRYKQEII